MNSALFVDFDPVEIDHVRKWIGTFGHGAQGEALGHAGRRQARQHLALRQRGDPPGPGDEAADAQLP